MVNTNTFCRLVHEESLDLGLADALSDAVVLFSVSESYVAFKVILNF